MKRPTQTYSNTIIVDGSTSPAAIQPPMIIIASEIIEGQPNRPIFLACWDVAFKTKQYIQK